MKNDKPMIISDLSDAALRAELKRRDQKRYAESLIPCKYCQQPIEQEANDYVPGRWKHHWTGVVSCHPEEIATPEF
jgi:hypothetical protein